MFRIKKVRFMVKKVTSLGERPKPEAILPVRCTFRIKTGAAVRGKKSGEGCWRFLAQKAKFT
jgi:hypothetical protein